MKAKSRIVLDQEPMGIVISSGPRLDPTPTFFAYVWAPDPEEPEEAGTPQAA